MTALNGVRVLDLSQGMAGPMATMILADHGADVLKVEPPSGDHARAERGFHMWNRGKRAIVLNLSDPVDERTLRALAERSDVIVASAGREGSAAPTVEGTSLTEASLIEMNPRAIHCLVDTWGPSTRVTDHGEATVSAAIGRMSALDRLSGGLAHPTRTGPGFTLPPVASFGAAMLATQGILASLLSRATEAGSAVSDEPTVVRTSLLQGAISFMMREDLVPREPGERVQDDDRARLLQRGIELCFLTAECADGRYIQMCARQDHHFRSWLEALGLHDVLDDPRFADAPLGIRSDDDIDELERLLRKAMLTRSQAEWMHCFTEEFDIGADPFLTPEEFLAHPQMVENGRVVEIDDPELGPTVQIGPLVSMPPFSAHGDRPAPRLDEHRAEILALADADAEPTATVTDEPAGPRSPGEGRGPLSGVTIIEGAYFVAGPLATTLLAELGARVIKVEPLAGDPYRRTGMQSTKFLHGKESIALDLKSPDGVAILDQLVERADAFIHSFRLGVPERLSIDFERLRSVNDRLVYLNAASYGSKGPEAGRIAFHSTPTALSGAGILQAGAGNPPVDDSFPDPAAGLGAATALLLGLLARERLGTGLELETTMLCSTGYVMSSDTVMSAGSTEARPADDEQLGLGALHRLYRCRDRWIFLTAGTGDARIAAARVVGLDSSELVSAEPATVPVDGDLGRSIEEILTRDDAEAWVERFRAAGVDAVIVHDAPLDDWLGAEDLLEPTEHVQFGTYWRLPPKVTVEPFAAVAGPACAIGEHADELLAELGHSPDRIDALRSAGVIG